MTPGEDLHHHIRGYVRGRVPDVYEDLVVEMVAKTVVLVMTTPEFYNHLTFVQELQLENQQLRQLLLSQRPAPRKKTAAKKTVARKRASSNVKQFRRGASGQ